jgi:hypothetical protein
MRKAQVLKFWKELRDSSQAGGVLKKFANKPGFDSRRNLERYAQAQKGFSKSESDQDIAKTTGWKSLQITKIRSWWLEAFPITNSGVPPPPGPPNLEIQVHREKLLKVLDVLANVEPLPLHDRDLATWWSRPEVSDWPVSKGRVWRERDGSLRVELNAESKREWRYLRQHLAGSQPWQAVEECKKALAADMAARLTLMDCIALSIQDAPDRGGLDLPIEADLGFIAVTRSVVTIYYLFTIHDQVLSQALGLRHAPKRKEEFDYRDPGYPEVVSLGGIPVIRSPDAKVRTGAVSFLVEAQERLNIAS